MSAFYHLLGGNLFCGNRITELTGTPRDQGYQMSDRKAPGKRPGYKLAQHILSVIRLPRALDSFVKNNPWLHESESFVKASLAIKRTIQELNLPLNLVSDIATQCEEDRGAGKGV
jgi:hypothetical protein